MVYLPRVYFLMAKISFHQWGSLPNLSILVLIHWLGWSTGSGIPLIQDQEKAAAEGMGTFRWAPPMWVGQHRWPPLWGGCGGCTDKGIEGFGALSHSSAVFPSRKVVRSIGSVGSLPKSPGWTWPVSFSGLWDGTPQWVPVEEEAALWYALGHHLSTPYSRILMAVGVGADHLGSSWAAHQQDMITGGMDRETDTCLDVVARNSGIFVTGSYSWNGNIASLILITQLKGLHWDIWLPLPPEALLKETGLGCGSIPYFPK